MRSIQKMTPEEKAGQLYLTGFNGTRMNDYLREIITEWKIGGLVFSVRNVENPIQVRDLIEEIQELAVEKNDIPLIITINQEGGDRTCFIESLTRNPGSMAIGATYNPRWAYEVAYIVGKELRTLGFNMLFMPVLDLSNLVDNTALGIRSFGENPELVAEMGVQFIKGLSDAGLASTAKHFPGAGGSAVDAHFDLPHINRNINQFENYELIPFKKAIKAGVSSLMTAHTDFVQIDQGVIATVSKKINTELARDRLGFKGIIFSDAYGMKGLIDNISPIQACVKSILAGVDIILKRHGRKANYAILKILREAIQSGQIPQTRIDESLKRIFALKQKICFNDQPDIANVLWNKNHIKKLEAMSEDSVTVLRNEKKLLPLKLNFNTKILLIMPDQLANASLDGTTGDPAGYIIRGILSEKYSYYTNGFDLIHYGIIPYQQEMEAVIKKAKNYDVLIFGSFRSNMLPGQPELINKNFSPNKKILWISLNYPFDLLDYPDAATYICTYGDRLPQLKALCRIICGEVTPKGRLPVNLPGLHKNKFGITSWK